MNGSNRTPKPEVVRAGVGRLKGRPSATSARLRISVRLSAALRMAWRSLVSGMISARPPQLFVHQ